MTFYQNQLIAMATSLNILENEVELYHLHPKRFHMVKGSAGSQNLNILISA